MLTKFLFSVIILFTSFQAAAESSAAEAFEKLLGSDQHKMSQADAERIIFDYLVHLESEGSTSKDWKIFFKYTDLELKLGIIPEIGIKGIRDIAKYGALALRMSRVGAASGVQSTISASKAALESAEITVIAEGFKGIIASAKEATEFIRILSDFKSIENGSEVGSDIMLLDADYKPLSNFIRAIEVLKILDKFKRLNNKNYFINFRNILMAEAYIDFISATRQVDGLRKVMGGKILANDFISILAFSMQDLPEDIKSELINYFDESIEKTSNKEKTKKS